jgi:hypothetical protein
LKILFNDIFRDLKNIYLNIIVLKIIIFLKKCMKKILKIKQWFKEAHVAPSNVLKPNPTNTPINLEIKPTFKLLN